MKKIFCGISAAALILCCFASCGSHTVPNDGVKVSAVSVNNRSAVDIAKEITGRWETTLELLDEEEVKPTYKRYEFLEDGSGTYYEPDGNAQQISWSVTADGGMKLIYDDNGEISELYEFIGCDMVTSKDTPESKREIHIAKVPVFTVDEKK
ncbi:hypothetical protein [Ruminococcus sp.]|uniref:hypothetical protein n=1 Tax=Ruminococcus sp. TaxID=41978 RepID=UPI0025D86624|nr:hypothetical protein [Ruminococcus sp.]